MSLLGAFRRLVIFYNDMMLLMLVIVLKAQKMVIVSISASTLRYNDPLPIQL